MNQFAASMIKVIPKFMNKVTELSTIILVDTGVGIAKTSGKVITLGAQAVDGVINNIDNPLYGRITGTHHNKSNLASTTRLLSRRLTHNIKKSAVEMVYSDKLIKQQYGSRENIPTDPDLPAEAPDVKAMTFYDKLINFLKKVLAKIETGLFYLGIACLTLASIFMLLVVMTGNELDVFVKGVSDAFSATFKLITELFTQSISGILRLDLENLKAVFKKAFAKFTKRIDDVKERFDKKGLDNVLYIITAMSLVGMVCVMYAILGGKSSNGTA